MARQLLSDQKSFWTGVSGYFITSESAKLLNVPPPGLGLLVQYVAKNSPAGLIGLRGGTTKATLDGETVILGGDIVLAVQGIPLTMKNYERIRDIVSQLDPTDLVRIKILRAGEQLELSTIKN